MGDAAALQQALADGLRTGGVLRDGHVEAAFRAVPWVALHDGRFCAVVAEGTAVDQALVPTLYGHGSQMRSTIGLLGQRGLALLSWTPDEMPAADANHWSADAPPSELQVRSFGLESGLTQRLHGLVVGWDAAGRPGGEHLRVRAYRRGEEPATSSPAQVITKNWTSLLLEWTSPP